MKKLGTLAAALTLTLGGSALAGYKAVSPVTIDAVARYAFGSLGSVRNSADAVQFLYCVANVDAVSATATCFAKNAAGTTVSCFSSNADLVRQVQSLSGDSWLRFDYDAAGSCTRLQIANGSQYEPKK